MQLDGKVALITGASHGIGRAIATMFARAGADVVITWRRREQGAADTVREIERTGRRALVLQAEMTKPDDCTRIVDRTIETFGQLDILVNNAGGGRRKPLLDVSLDDWRYTLDLCVTAPFLCSQHAARHMLEHGGGAIVNISSVHAASAWPNDSAYGVAKAGLVRLTESMALEWARFGIRVNCIAPGYIKVATTAEEQTRYEQEERHATPIIPAQRVGRPEDIASAALFLVAADASYITGHTLYVDGGLLLPPVTTAAYLRGDREGRDFSG